MTLNEELLHIAKLYFICLPRLRYMCALTFLLCCYYECFLLNYYDACMLFLFLTVYFYALYVGQQLTRACVAFVAFVHADFK